VEFGLPDIIRIQITDKESKSAITSFVIGTSQAIVLGLEKNKADDSFELRAIDINNKKIPEKALYFVRSKLPEDITDNNFNEHVTYGELNHNLADSLKNLTHHCFLPFLKDMDRAKWG
jgi:hypothetical protein